MIDKFSALLFLATSLFLSGCEKTIPENYIKICDGFMAKETELLNGYESAGITTAEFVGDSFYTTKIGGHISNSPEETFFCTWTKDRNGDDYTYVEIMFRIDPKTLAMGELLSLSEVKLQNNRNKTIRVFRYETSSFQTFD